MKTYLSFTASILFFLCSCGEDVMDRTIFIPDEKDKNLPAYTEWGYNSFGAKYERLYFLATNDIVPCKILYQNGILDFCLSGNLFGNIVGDYYEKEKMTLTFSFPFPAVNVYADLVSLNNTQIDLTNASSLVSLARNYKQPENITVQSGRLFFKRAQLLRIDDEEDRVILSGYFDIQFLLDGKPEKISDGRFDLGINTDFYYYGQSF